MDQVVWRETR